MINKNELYDTLVRIGNDIGVPVHVVDMYFEEKCDTNIKDKNNKL